MKKMNFNQEQTRVLNAILQMTTSFHNKDIEGVMSSYETNPMIIFEPGKPALDRKAIIEGFKGFFALNPKFEYSGHEVFVNGDLAVHFAPWTMNGKTPDGTEIKQSGLSVAVLRKQVDGKWLMVFDNPFGQNLLDQQ
jgi:ketosteroid isomerase-like protein